LLVLKWVLFEMIIAPAAVEVRGNQAAFSSFHHRLAHETFAVERVKMKKRSQISRPNEFSNPSAAICLGFCYSLGH
jgi:hypothetical protein